VTSYEDVIATAVRVTEAVGSAGMFAGGAAVLLVNAPAVLAGRMDDSRYQRLRRALGRVILVGLEILIIADIVRTILVSATLTNVAELGAVVLIRTVLSFSLDIEIDGVLPWRAAERTAPAGPGARP
jgi:uncharacterized membrane protein